MNNFIFFLNLLKCELQILANMQTQQNMYPTHSSATMGPDMTSHFKTFCKLLLIALGSESMKLTDGGCGIRLLCCFLSLVEVELMTLLLPHGKLRNTLLGGSLQRSLKCYKEQSAMFHKACRTFNAHHNNN